MGVGVGVVVSVGVGIVTATVFAEGVADWLTWLPWGKILKLCVMVFVIPDVSIVSIVIVWEHDPREIDGLNDQYPLESAVTWV